MANINSNTAFARFMSRELANGECIAIIDLSYQGKIIFVGDLIKHPLNLADGQSPAGRCIELIAEAASECGAENAVIDCCPADCIGDYAIPVAALDDVLPDASADERTGIALGFAPVRPGVDLAASILSVADHIDFIEIDC